MFSHEKNLNVLIGECRRRGDGFAHLGRSQAQQEIFNLIPGFQFLHHRLNFLERRQHLAFVTIDVHPPEYFLHNALRIDNKG